jgi:sulfate permease, SulP family
MPMQLHSSFQNTLACNLWLYKVFPWLRWRERITRANLRADATAGLTGALIVLPQAVAFATIAGLPPEFGLYAAMVPTITAALWGSSWHLVSGPTTAISIVVFSSISPIATPGSPEYIGLALTLTLLTGALQLAMGMMRLGALVNFISHTVIIGFTAGAAILIAGSQVKNFFGLDIPRGANLREVLGHLLLYFEQINPHVTAVAALTLVAAIFSRKRFPKFPYMIAAMVAGSLVAYGLNLAFGPDVTGIHTVGALPRGLPPLSVPDFSFDALHQTVFPALVVTVLALTEAVSIARSVAVKSEQRIDGNQEFIGQGLSNIMGSFFSGYASSGSFNRSGVNYEGGARTPLSAVFSAIFLIIILLLVAPLAAYLPHAAMAAVLFVVAWSLIDFHHIREILRTSREESVVLGVTFFGTLIDLEKGIFFGIILSLLYYLQRTSRPTIRTLIPDPADLANPKRKFLTEGRDIVECPQMKMMRVEGSIFFGAVDHVQQALTQVDEINPGHRNLLLLCRGINFIDLSGGEMLAREALRRRRLGGNLYLCGVKEGLCAMLQRGGFMERIGRDNIFRHKGEAIAAIYRRLNPEICRGCTARIFHECQLRLPNGLPRDGT